MNFTIRPRLLPHQNPVLFRQRRMAARGDHALLIGFGAVS
jgi:hypothetical protein